MKPIHLTAEQIRFKQIHDIPSPHMVVCGYCKHFRYENGKAFCKAFPDGIPRELMYKNDHDIPYPGDHGVRFEPKSERDLQDKIRFVDAKLPYKHVK
jgi:hypothetical protein